jgi:hydroxypyruvate isomerase
MSTTTSLRFDANLKWLFTELPFEERFEAAAKAGFKAVEYSSPYEYSADFLLKCLADAGLEQVLINCPTGAPDSPTRNGSACIPDRVDEFRAGYLSALEYAVALGAGVIHVNAGVRPDDVSRDHAFATYVNNIGWAAEQAASTDVTLALEAMNQRDAPGFVLESIEQAAAVVRAIGGSHVGVMFDVYHLQVGQGDLATRLHALYPLIAHIQIADAPHRTEPGTGEIAWPFIFGQIESLGYGGWIGCEYAPVSTTLDGLSWLDEFGGA